MWEFAAQQPGWFLAYLIVVCFSVTMIAGQLASAMWKTKETQKTKAKEQESVSETRRNDETS